MRIFKNIEFAGWSLLIFHSLIFFSSIWVLTRISPIIEVIIKQNELSLHESRNMLSFIGLNRGGDEKIELIEKFRKSLNFLKGNVTEKGEVDAIKTIENNYEKSFDGDYNSTKEIIKAISVLSDINREAMIMADKKAKKFGSKGAWSVAFMGILSFLFQLIFINNLKRNLFEPLDEVDIVLKEFSKGNVMRRCCKSESSKEIEVIKTNINDILDISQNKNIGYF
ncbi:MAG: hypothetical protein CR982_02695 [Candidatus Cloacimonadota bacterium]|nr:MAG: hypothetical protein CR982_02695 [Candidatus Cloacimonadota bacterium]PIE79338.1 MAG: hypothetical protein CSA15_03550 [Candidatus Delongbacteria bacterium]